MGRVGAGSGVWVGGTWKVDLVQFANRSVVGYERRKSQRQFLDF